MKRTDTKNLKTFTRSGEVTYILPENPSSTIVTIILPPNSTWTSGAHWHETHTEYLHVVKGAAKVTIQKHTRVYRPSDGIITVPKFAVHEWGRVVDKNDPEFHDELVVEEWTDPADGLKEVFFRNLNSVILDSGRRTRVGDLMLTVQLWVIFYHLDNWPVIINGPGWLRWTITHFIIRFAGLIGSLWGIQGVYKEYTPLGLVDRKHV